MKLYILLPLAILGTMAQTPIAADTTNENINITNSSDAYTLSKRDKIGCFFKCSIGQKMCLSGEVFNYGSAQVDGAIAYCKCWVTHRNGYVSSKWTWKMLV